MRQNGSRRPKKWSTDMLDEKLRSENLTEAELSRILLHNGVVDRTVTEESRQIGPKLCRSTSFATPLAEDFCGGFPPSDQSYL